MNQEKLKKHGLKITNQRLEILDVLDKSKKPISAYDIKDQLKDKYNISTIYRVLEKFIEKGIVHKLEKVNLFSACHSGHSNHCHHFLICKDCNSVEEFESEELCQVSEKLSKEYKFKPQNHSLELVGICNKCCK